MITSSNITTTSRGLDTTKALIDSPIFTARLEPIGKLFNLPFLTEMSIDLWPRELCNACPQGTRQPITLIYNCQWKSDPFFKKMVKQIIQQKII